MSENKPKKVFVSYAWTSPEYSEQIVEISKRLMAVGIDVVLDKWDLKPGHDMNHFMEQSVNDESIDKVLLFVNENYKQKADKREGGVGTESTVISAKVYADVKNEKFIPIITEVDENKKAYMPAFLSSRIYINFADESNLEEEFEQLVRFIYDAPVLTKPQLGKAPGYITEDKINTFKTAYFVKSVKNLLEKNPKSINRLTDEFFQIFEEELWNFELNGIDSNDYSVILKNRLQDFQDLKKPFVDFIFFITSEEYSVDESKIIGFFEKANCYLKPKDEIRSSYQTRDFEIFRIVFQELFIYVIASCIKNSNFNLAREFLFGSYSFDCEYRGSSSSDRTFCGIIKIPEAFNQINKQSILPIGTYFLNNLFKVSKEEFVTADVICHIASFLFLKQKSYYDWYPYSNVHYGSSRSYDKLKFFEKLVSSKYYNKVKPLFDDYSIDNLKTILLKYKSQTDRRINFGIFNEIPFIHEFVDPDKLASER